MISRRKFLKLSMGALASTAAVAALPVSLDAYDSEAGELIHLPILRNSRKPPTDKPNVLFIGIDDLNDWLGCLGGHPNAKSPNIDLLAGRSILFERAYCTYPMCNASRAALMTGVAPHSSGIYTNETYFRTSPPLTNAPTIPQYFKQHGYYATGAGKMYCAFADPPSWDDYWPDMQTLHPPTPRPPDSEFPLSGLVSANPFFDWGVLNIAKEDMDDWQVADRVSEMLQEDYDQPFFIACGFFDTHQPFYAPQEYFDRHPLSDVALPELPPYPIKDLADVPEIGRRLANGYGEHALITQEGTDKWRDAVRSYLACISLVDDCVGRVLDTLYRSPYVDNTIVVLWSDHGWHLGEKHHWKKNAIWEDTTRNVLMFSGPGVDTPGWRVDTPVSLLDIYPTLVELCGLEPNDLLEGHSLYPMFGYEQPLWPWPAVTSVLSRQCSPNYEISFGIRKDHWRYIHYADGSEELYDHRSDPNEWYNLARKGGSNSVMQELAQWRPQNPMPPLIPCPSGLSPEEETYLLND